MDTVCANRSVHGESGSQSESDHMHSIVFMYHAKHVVTCCRYHRNRYANTNRYAMYKYRYDITVNHTSSYEYLIIDYIRHT